MGLLFNPWFWLAAIVALGASNAATAWFSYGAGKDHCIAEQARDVAVAQIASEAAASAVSEGLAKIKVTNTTIRQTLEKEVRENTVYRDCRSGPDAVRLLNATATGSALPASGASQLPASSPAAR